jgi:hypothetical protein
MYKRSSVDKEFVVFMILFVLSIPCLGLLWPEYEYSTGFRDGVVQKFSLKGIWWKTHEGELAMSSFVHRGESISNLWEFTVSDPGVVAKLQMLPPRAVVRLKYKEIGFAKPWNGSTGYRITDVEFLHLEGEK